MRMDGNCLILGGVLFEELGMYQEAWSYDLGLCMMYSISGKLVEDILCSIGNAILLPGGMSFRIQTLEGFTIAIYLRLLFYMELREFFRWNYY